MNRELLTHKAVVALLATAAVDADASSDYVDLQGFDAAEFLVPFGDVTAAAGSNNLVITLEEAASGADPEDTGVYTPVAANDLVGALTQLQNGVTAGVGRVGYIGTGRYVRAVVTATGTASASLGVIAILENSVREPANSLTPSTGTPA